jgi:hypothetical protein
MIPNIGWMTIAPIPCFDARHNDHNVLHLRRLSWLSWVVSACVCFVFWDPLAEPCASFPKRTRRRPKLHGRIRGMLRSWEPWDTMGMEFGKGRHKNRFYMFLLEISFSSAWRNSLQVFVLLCLACESAPFGSGYYGCLCQYASGFPYPAAAWWEFVRSQ